MMKVSNQSSHRPTEQRASQIHAPTQGVWGEQMLLRGRL